MLAVWNFAFSGQKFNRPRKEQLHLFNDLECGRHGDEQQGQSLPGSKQKEEVWVLTAGTPLVSIGHRPQATS